MKDRNSFLPQTAEIVISSAEDARRLLHSALPLWPGSRRRVVVNITGIPVTEQRKWGSRLGMWLNACGCHTGALFAVVAMAGCIIVLWHKPAFEWLALLKSFGVVATVTLIGKLFGLGVARLMLVIDLKRLIRQTSSSNTFVNYLNR